MIGCYLPEVPASSAIAIASEEVPQVQDLEVDLSKIDLAELVWGLGVSNLNTQNASGLPKPCVEVSVKCLAPRSFTWPNLQPLMTKPRRSCPTALTESYLCRPNSTRRPWSADDGPRLVGFTGRLGVSAQVTQHGEIQGRCNVTADGRSLRND